MAVRCRGVIHHLRLVRNGSFDGRFTDDAFVLDDHPDVDAERTLVALGGVKPACLERLEAWREAIVDGGFLAEWSGSERVPAARVAWLRTALERTRSEGIQEFLHHVPLARAARMGRFVVDFDGTWLDRAALMVARRVISGEPVACDQAPRLIIEAASLRLRRAFVASLAEGAGVAHGLAALIPLRVHVNTGGEPRVAGRLAGRASWAEISIDRTWLTSVWGNDRAVVDGHLTL